MVPHNDPRTIPFRSHFSAVLNLICTRKHPTCERSPARVHPFERNLLHNFAKQFIATPPHVHTHTLCRLPIRLEEVPKCLYRRYTVISCATLRDTSININGSMCLFDCAEYCLLRTRTNIFSVCALRRKKCNM